jgi:hypothetical protein
VTVGGVCESWGSPCHAWNCRKTLLAFRSALEFGWQEVPVVDSSVFCNLDIARFLHKIRFKNAFRSFGLGRWFRDGCWNLPKLASPSSHISAHHHISSSQVFRHVHTFSSRICAHHHTSSAHIFTHFLHAHVRTHTHHHTSPCHWQIFFSDLHISPRILPRIRASSWPICTPSCNIFLHRHRPTHFPCKWRRTLLHRRNWEYWCQSRWTCH